MLLKHKSTIKDALSVHRGVTRRVKWAQSWVLLSPSYAKLYCWVLLQPTAGSVVSVGLTWLDLQYAEPSIHAWADPFRLFFPLGGKRDRSCSIFEVRRRRHLQKLMMEASVLCVCVCVSLYVWARVCWLADLRPPWVATTGTATATAAICGLPACLSQQVAGWSKAKIQTRLNPGLSPLYLRI